MDIISTDDPKISIAAKIPSSWSDEIDAICHLSGLNKSQWVSDLIADALCKNDKTKQKAVKKLSLLIAQAV